MKSNKRIPLSVRGTKIPLTKEEKEDKIYDEISGSLGDLILKKLKDYRSNNTPLVYINKNGLETETKRPTSKLSVLSVGFSLDKSLLYRKNSRPETIETKIRKAKEKFGIK